MRPTVSYPSVTGADARALLHDDRLVVLALETIGHGGAAEIVAVAVLNRHGQVLLHTRIRSTRPIPALADAPSLDSVWPTLAALLTGRIVVSFQVATVRRVLRQSARWLGATVMYTKWQSLAVLSRSCARATSCREPQGAFRPTRAVLAEARMALAVLRALAGPPIHIPPPRRVFWRYL